MPASLVLARGAGAWIEHVPRLRWVTIGTASLAAAALLGSFYVNYFRAFATTGGRSHLTYVTAPIEPKQQALIHILGRSAGAARVEIATRQWWLYWPIAYLATPHPTVSVRLDADADAGAGSSRRRLAARRGSSSSSPARPSWRRRCGASRRPATGSRRTTIADAGGRDHLVIVEVATDRP